MVNTKYVFRTQSNIFNGAFLQKQLTDLSRFKGKLFLTFGNLTLVSGNTKISVNTDNKRMNRKIVNCLEKKFCVKIKLLKFGTKNALLG